MQMLVHGAIMASEKAAKDAGGILAKDLAQSSIKQVVNTGIRVGLQGAPGEVIKSAANACLMAPGAHVTKVITEAVFTEAAHQMVPKVIIKTASEQVANKLAMEAGANIAKSRATYDGVLNVLKAFV